MKSIKIETWKANSPEKNDAGEVTGVKEVEENLLSAINVLIAMKKPEEIPRGIEKFQIFGKLADAFDEAMKTKILNLEEREYTFVKDLITKDVPSSWAFNKDLKKAINEFMEAKDK